MCKTINSLKHILQEYKKDEGKYINNVRTIKLVCNKRLVRKLLQTKLILLLQKKKREREIMKITTFHIFLHF